MSLKSNDMPPFIADQQMFRLNAPWSGGQMSEWLRDRRFRFMAEGEKNSPDSEFGWEAVDDRTAFLADPAIKRLCMVEDAGMGKTKSLEQIQYLRQAADPGHLAVRFEFHQLPNDHNAYLGSIDGKTPRLIAPLQVALGSSSAGADSNEVQKRLLRLVHRKIRQGQFTLLVDALDQANQAKSPKETAEALASFLVAYPKVRCVISGRPFAVQYYWDSLFACDTTIGSTGPWELVQIDSFTDEQQKTFLGSERYKKLKQLDSDVIAIPRALETVRSLSKNELNGVRTASDLYWRCVDKMLERGLANPPVKMKKNRALKLFSLLAFETVSQGNFADLETFIEDIWIRRGDELQYEYNGDSERFEADLGRLVAVNLLLDPGVLAVKADGNPFAAELTHLNWRNRTLQDFLAALWVTRYSTSAADRDWLRTHPYLRGEGHRHYAHGKLYEFWRLAAEMPGAKGTQEAARRDQVWISSLSVLFLRPPEGEAVVRSTEIIYRSWRGLLGIAGHLRDENAFESLVQAITTKLQHQIRAAVESNEGSDLESQLPDEPPLAARWVIRQFLGEFPQLVGESSADSPQRRFDRDMPSGEREGFVSILAGEFWMGDAESGYMKEPLHKSAVDGGFQLSGCTVTNAVYQQFDPTHAERFSEYEKCSSEPDCPVIHLNWYDAWCVSLWLHGRLPSEHEWEYVCRGKSGMDEPPTKWCFGDDEKLLREYAWVRENTKKTRSVGTRRPNGFGVSDVHGNVWEWTSSWWHKNPEEGRKPDFVGRYRVLRGGSFDDGDVSVCRSACRVGRLPPDAVHVFGVRVARAIPENHF